MVTGASTRWTLPSSTKISTARSHSSLTCSSFKISHLFSCRIHASKSIQLLPRASARALSGPCARPLPGVIDQGLRSAGVLSHHGAHDGVTVASLMVGAAMACPAPIWPRHCMPASDRDLGGSPDEGAGLAQPLRTPRGGGGEPVQPVATPPPKTHAHTRKGGVEHASSSYMETMQ